MWHTPLTASSLPLTSLYKLSHHFIIFLNFQLRVSNVLFFKQLWLTDLEIFAVLTAALIHDYEHTGTTNAFQINTKFDLKSILQKKNF